MKTKKWYLLTFATVALLATGCGKGDKAGGGNDANNGVVHEFEATNAVLTGQPAFQTLMTRITNMSFKEESSLLTSNYYYGGAPSRLQFNYYNVAQIYSNYSNGYSNPSSNCSKLLGFIPYCSYSSSSSSYNSTLYGLSPMFIREYSRNSFDGAEVLTRENSSSTYVTKTVVRDLLLTIVNSGNVSSIQEINSGMFTVTHNANGGTQRRVYVIDLNSPISANPISDITYNGQVPQSGYSFQSYQVLY